MKRQIIIMTILFLPLLVLAAKSETDTLVVKQVSEAGYYGKGKTEYFLVGGKDTSNFSCAFWKSKDGQRVSGSLQPRRKGLRCGTYRQCMSEFEKIVTRQVSKDFDLSRLGCLYLPISSFGDLAIEVTKKCTRKKGINRVKYREFVDAIASSSLKGYLEGTLRAYGVALDEVGAEKLIIVGKRELLENGILETPPADVPRQFMDCLSVEVYFKAK